MWLQSRFSEQSWPYPSSCCCQQVGPSLIDKYGGGVVLANGFMSVDVVVIGAEAFQALDQTESTFIDGSSVASDEMTRAREDGQDKEGEDGSDGQVHFEQAWSRTCIRGQKLW